MIYGFIDKSDFDVMLSTCSKTDSPPRPIKNDVNRIIVVISFVNDVKKLIPLVNSIIPIIIPCSQLFGNSLSILLWNRIDIIIEKSVINPPIVQIVIREFFIEFPSISPIFLKSIYVGLSSLASLFLFVFQNLKINPIVNVPRICVKRSRVPMFLFLKKQVPIVPIINIGPELFVNDKSLSPSSCVSRSLFRKSVTIFAPVGYPLIIPMIKGNAPIPGTLNNGCIYLFNF